MAQQFKNNARALLVAGISDTDTSFVVESAKADFFPVANTGANPIPASTDWYKVTLQNSSGAVEIVAVRTRTAGSGIMSNVLRGQDGTTALNFLAGTVVGLRITADDLQTALGLPSQNNTFTGNNAFSGANSFAGAVSGQGLINLLYPVGSVYINATNNTNPGALFGVGTWVAFGAGRVPVGVDAGNPLFDTAEETGGSYDATLVSHNHSGTTGNENQNHSHGGATDGVGNHAHTTNFGFSADHDYFGNGVSSFTYNGGGVTQNPYQYNSEGAGAHSHNFTTSGISNNHQHGFTTSTSGSSATNANIQPFITVFMWKRTA